MWRSISKNVFVEYHILKLHMYDAVIIFKDGNASRLEELGTKMAILKELNKEQIDKVRLQTSVLSKKARSLEKWKRIYLDNTEENEHYSGEWF